MTAAARGWGRGVYDNLFLLTKGFLKMDFVGKLKTNRPAVKRWRGGGHPLVAGATINCFYCIFSSLV